MQRFLMAMLSFAFILGMSGAADAKACRDAKGKFTKCKTAMSTPMKSKTCRDAKGKFMKCKSSMSGMSKM